MFDSFEKYSGMWNPLTLEEFLEKYPNSSHAGEAREVLDNMQ